MSSVTTLFAPITLRSPDGHAARDHHVRPAPDVVADPGRPLAREALPGDRLVGVVEAMVRVRHEAAVREHAVIADLHELGGCDHDARCSGTCPRRSGSARHPARLARRAARTGCPRRSRAGPRGAPRARSRGAASGRTPAAGPARDGCRAGSRGASCARTSATSATTVERSGHVGCFWLRRAKSWWHGTQMRDNTLFDF